MQGVKKGDGRCGVEGAGWKVSPLALGSPALHHPPAILSF